jgi:hypothetical protein
MNIKNLSIKDKLISLIAVFIVASLIIGIAAYQKIVNINKLNNLAFKTEKIKILALELRKNEKDFLIREKTNPTFFLSGESKYLSLHDSNYNKLKKLLDTLSTSHLILNFELKEDIKEIVLHAENYKKNFSHVCTNPKLATITAEKYPP